MAAFDLAGARQHYSDAEIADFLGQQNKFDTAGARKAGYSDQDIITHLTGAAKAAPAEPESDHTFLGDLGHNALGAAQIAGASIANIPGGIINAGADFLARATGHTEGSHPVGMVQPGQAGRDFASQGADLVERGIEATGGGNAVAHGVGATDEAVRTAAANHPALANGVAAAGDVAALAGARGIPGLKIAPGVSATVPSAVSRVVRGVTTAAGDTDQAAAQAAQAAKWQQLGFKTGQEGVKAGVGQALTGDTARPALINNNADVFNAGGSAEAGVPHNVPLSPEALEAARVGPNSTYERVAKALPSGELDAQAKAGVQNAGGDLTNDATKTQLNNIKANVLAAKDGNGLVNQLRSMRQEGFTRAASEDVDQQQLGRAQLDIANHIEEHIGRNLPTNGDVSLEQFQQARKALAKNYTVQGALRGSDIDPNVLARIQRADPGLLDGHLKDMADFANNNREVVGLPSRLNAPSLVKDIRNIDIMHPVGSTATALGGALGRRLLTGGPAAGRATARAAMPGRLGDEFAPLSPQPPQPPPGMAVAGEGAGGPHGPPAGQPGDIPLADVLSHGVERSPPPGLTAGPMGAPQGEGLPFRVNAEHAAGGLGLAPEPSLGDLLADLHRSVGSNSDLPGVMSQGVPEGTMTRTPQPAPGTRSNRGPGMRLGDMLTNNASGESAASQEAINRGTRNLVQIDPDGNETPVLRDVTQIDRSAPKGHLIVDKDNGDIVSRGGQTKAGAEGLRNRWASRQRLGDTFVSK